MSRDLPSLEHPTPGTVCRRCGYELRVEGFCPECSDGAGRYLAAGILEEAQEVNAGRLDPRFTCVDCGRSMRSRGVDGRCHSCAELP